ncbi:MAG: pyruvate, phosphate dikinase [Deltaproteobacteria bacterium]|nr:pyruvate, phosphate dikinase [Deltaproteobacteria bacterium]
MMKYVYTFAKGKAEGTPEQVALLGNKGAGLAAMARLNVPLPPGFTITTEVGEYHLAHQQDFPDALAQQVAAGIRHIEKAMRAGFGDPKRPLLVSVRSGAAVSMPGMMDSVLNLGLTDATVAGLIHRTDNPRFGYDSYRRFIQMYGDVVLGIPADLFEQRLAAMKEARGARSDLELTATDLEALAAEFLALVATESGRPFPQDAEAQLWGAVGAVFASWNTRRATDYRRIHGLSHQGGTACTVQAMVFGNLGPTSATGVAFTRDPAGGAKRFFGEYLPNAQGEDVVAGIRTPRPINRPEGGEGGPGETLEETHPECYRQLVALYHQLENQFRDMQDIEFTIQEGELWLLQTRAGKRTIKAAVKIAVDLVEEGLLTKEEAIGRVNPHQLDQLLHPTIDPATAVTPLARGLAASPGAAVGRIVFAADTAVAWHQQGEAVVLVRQETSPDDIHGMHVSQGFCTARGGLTSHAAVVARGMGKPCVVGCEALRIDPAAKALRIGQAVLREGDWLSINGSTGDVIAGRVPTVQPAIGGEFHTLMQWADAVRRLKVRANADTPHDAETALGFGAEGIGLVRTEHMFFDPQRVPVVREVILAEDLDARRRALAKLLPMQKTDFKAILGTMHGHPVTVRLLDIPLHEFLPTRPAEVASLATAMAVSEAAVQQRVAALHEFNPMLGHRGCRLGITQPEIYGMQVQALLEAACELKRDAAAEALLEIEVPLVAHMNELRYVRAVVERVAEEVIARTGVRVPYKIGTMLELPRACLTADQIARYADFFSFGTNDLTQTTFGISRDDAGGFLRAYGEKHLLPSDPFVSIDPDGVGELMRIAVTKARAANPRIEIGICGEHGGEPASVALCHRLGLDYVSCSPYRVPIARLAAAQAAVKDSA